MHVLVQRLVLVVKMETMLEDYTTKEEHSVVCFLWAKGLSAKDIHEKMFPVHGGSVCCIKWFTTGLINSLKDI
jgi:hypothetical protein